MKRVYKKNIIITGGTGLLGSYFYKKYKKKYNIIKYPFRIENHIKFKNWIKGKKIDYFIHFAAITTNKKATKNKINLINTISSKKILNSLNSFKINTLKYFLFISTSQVYGSSNQKIKENKKRLPINEYGKSKKRVEDYIIKNRQKFSFKIGIARIFNFTGPKQRKGYFVPDIVHKMNKNKLFKDLNKYRDFIHIEDIMLSINLLLRKQFILPINICSGYKINLINLCNIINTSLTNKKIFFDYKKGSNSFGCNNLLKSLGIKKFKNISKILESYL